MSFRKPWLQQEDELIRNLVSKYGTKNWSQIASQIHHNYGFKERTGKQCRQRWHNHLNPVICRKSWTHQEEQLMFALQKEHGNKWTVIAESLPGRTDNTIKNHFYSTIRRSLRRMSKLIGEKNSTTHMKKIKPSTLSRLFMSRAILQDLEKAPGKELSIAQKEMRDFINENYESVTDHLMQFTNYKPKGKKGLAEDSKQQFRQVVTKIITINQLYEIVKAEEKKIKKTEKGYMGWLDSSGDEEPDHDSAQSVKREESSPEVIISECRTRSRREVRLPKYRILNLAANAKTPLRSPEKKEKEHESVKVENNTSLIILNENGDREKEESVKFDIFNKEEDIEFEPFLNPIYSPGYFFAPTPLSHLRNLSPQSRQKSPLVNSGMFHKEYDEVFNTIRLEIACNLIGCHNPDKATQTPMAAFPSPTSAFKCLE